jgi:leucyl aminopeptidase
MAPALVRQTPGPSRVTRQEGSPVVATLTPPSPLVDVEHSDDVRRGVPLVVVACAPPDHDGVLIGPHADRLGVDAAWLAAAAATGSAGSVHAVARPGSRPAVGWVLGAGAGSGRDLRRAGAALARTVDARAVADKEAGRPVARSVQVALPDGLTGEQVEAFTIGAVLGSYAFRITGDDRPARVRTLVLVSADDHGAAIRRGLVLAGATALSRDLANMPSNTKNPAWLGDVAARIAGTAPGLTAKVRDVAWLREHGFGGVLAVGAGSASPPRLIELAWRPRGAAKAPHLVLVGKGITFDTGGISIKPADNLHLMRTDMAGGGTVIAALVAIARLGLPVRVTGLVPAAENHVSGSAYRPGDVVRHYDGRTTEVTNTDAEGRMVLADALGYAVRTLRPDLLVDVATLTGAIRIALGWRTGGLFASDDDVAEQVVAAGERAGEAWWRLPLGYDVVDLDTEHAQPVHSQVADLRQCPPGPGSIAAALFLREFTGGLRWAHLDIAGAARSEKQFDEVPVGATGFSTRTLVELAGSLAR